MINKDKYLYSKIKALITLILVIDCYILSSCKAEEPDILYSSDLSVSAAEEETSEASVETVTQAMVYVQVNGAVNNPGVYQVQSDLRVFQVIPVAGGFTEQADKEAVNMARPVQDEMVIYVPEIGENIQDMPSFETESQAGKINLNTASKESLMTLPGIGEAKASAIITYREEQGGFSDISQLMEISGIKESVFERIKENITV